MMQRIQHLGKLFKALQRFEQFTPMLYSAVNLHAVSGCDEVIFVDNARSAVSNLTLPRPRVSARFHAAHDACPRNVRFHSWTTTATARCKYIDTTTQCASYRDCCRTLHSNRVKFLWSPYVIGQTIIFLPCDFYPISSFFPRLVSAVGCQPYFRAHMAWP